MSCDRDRVERGGGGVACHVTETGWREEVEEWRVM